MRIVLCKNFWGRFISLRISPLVIVYWNLFYSDIYFKTFHWNNQRYFWIDSYLKNSFTCFLFHLFYNEFLKEFVCICDRVYLNQASTLLTIFWAWKHCPWFNHTHPSSIKITQAIPVLSIFEIIQIVEIINDICHVHKATRTSEPGSIKLRRRSYVLSR